MIGIEEIERAQRVELLHLIAWVGSQTRLASQLNVSRQTVHNWVSRGRISALKAIEVEDKTDGLFKKEVLRPDVIEWRKGI